MPCESCKRGLPNENSGMRIGSEHLDCYAMLVLAFILGVLNFAMHKAVLESGHPLLGEMPWFVHMLSGRFSIGVEFIVLLAAMLLGMNGYPAAIWAYCGYTIANAFAAWMIVTRRI